MYLKLEPVLDSWVNRHSKLWVSPHEYCHPPILVKKKSGNMYSWYAFFLGNKVAYKHYDLIFTDSSIFCSSCQYMWTSWSKLDPIADCYLLGFNMKKRGLWWNPAENDNWRLTGWYLECNCATLRVLKELATQEKFQNLEGLSWLWMPSYVVITYLGSPLSLSTLFFTLHPSTEHL